jgi:hypothetical protein
VPTSRTDVKTKLGAALFGAASLFLSSGCSLFQKSDKAELGDFLAARIYHQDRYERACTGAIEVTAQVEKGCHDLKGLLDLWKRLNTVANDAQKVGTMPDEEAEEIEAVWKKVKKLP